MEILGLSNSQQNSATGRIACFDPGVKAGSWLLFAHFNILSACIKTAAL